MTRQTRTMKKTPAPAADPLAVYRLLGLTRRAGRVISGTEAVHKAIRQHQARLVILAEDAAERTIRQVQQAADNSRIPVTLFGDKQQIGQWTGTMNRAVIAVVDTHFAARLQELTGQIAASRQEA